ncbi:hypothetical protein ACHAW5_005806 [Stephanodiscus triporus]|uniref:Uncharacterized protein n=1 Tax=Stephanodiscus triporus TaxID=2934178 RepID=A0ABD3PYC5_9STRA
MVQEMGRVDRLHTADVGTNSYSIYLNLNTFLSLWMRVQCETNALVKDRTNDELQSILRCLVLPEQCYHSLIENHFKTRTGVIRRTDAVTSVPTVTENKLIKQAIWKGKGGQILELSVSQNSKEANNNKIPLKTIEIGLAKEYVYVDDICKTLSIYVDANWEGIPHDP